MHSNDKLNDWTEWLSSFYSFVTFYVDSKPFGDSNWIGLWRFIDFSLAHRIIAWHSKLNSFLSLMKKYRKQKSMQIEWLKPLKFNTTLLSCVEHRIFVPKSGYSVHTKRNRQGQLPSGYTSVAICLFTTYG